MSPRTVTVRLTIPQLRAVNSALALLEADMDDDVHADVKPAVLDRTRNVVWAAFPAGVST